MVLIVSAVFPPEPVVSAKLSFDLASELSLTHEVTVISPRPTRPYGFDFKSTDLKHTFRHEILESYTCAQSNNFGRLRESYSFGRAASRYIIENHERIHVIYLNTWPLFAQFYVIRKAKDYNIPVVVHVQDIYPESLTKKIPLWGSIIKGSLLQMDKYVLNYSTAIVAISENMGAYLIKTRGLNNSKVSIIPNWQNEALFIRQEGEFDPSRRNSEPFTFMYFGNIGPVAGVGLLIKAFSNICLENCRLVIAGSGSMKAFAIKKAQKNHEVRIEFWDVPEGKEAEVQSMADVLLLPLKKGNSFSSVPSKLPAYMFSAKPILASLDLGSDTARVITNSGCGWLVKPEHEEELGSMMKLVFSLDKQKLKEMGIKGRIYALENFSKQKNLQRLVQIISQTISVCHAEKEN